ncbi:DUF167 domain-containing protein [Agrobacterium sp. Azo12]|jgi:uncharacterized protein YggU (UPF0235/DUF167 family)|uniref:DUF167 domain-containing protein n=1 Tax=Agrobacterium sp. Azo12 TaxID=3031129 RepID=UPI0023D810DC|nr:DUF167 domain-containing protein [Agrobacterium sp. Azo12]MDO5893806.1 DUF167 domain-containing protein [Agrobacterium sp. Azo12]
MTDRPWTAFNDHLRLSVRLTPNGGRDVLEKQETSADDDVVLKARVSAVPENGKANKALIALLAKSLRVPKSTISFISGETARKKILRIDADPEDLIIKLEKLLDQP